MTLRRLRDDSSSQGASGTRGPPPGPGAQTAPILVKSPSGASIRRTRIILRIMSALVIAALVALLAGVAIGFQNPLTSLIGQRVGLLGAAFAVHVAGAVVAGALLLAAPATAPSGWRGVPWLMAAAGILGVVFLTSISYTIPRIGIAATVGLMLAAQLSIAAWLDHQGLMGVAVRPFDAGRLLGLALLIAGAWLVLRR